MYQHFIKKIIIIIFWVAGTACFASNNLQKQAEVNLNNLYKNKFSQEEVTAILNYMLLSQDYLMSTNNTLDSMYNHINNLISENCNIKENAYLIRCDYFKKIKESYKFLGENQHNMKQNITNFKQKYPRIIISDKDYPYLQGTLAIYDIWLINSIRNFPIDKF